MRAQLAFFALPLAALVPGCFVYDKAWIDLANSSGGSLTGGSSAGGTAPSDGGNQSGGTPNAGGQKSGGSTSVGGSGGGVSSGGNAESGGMGGDAPTGGQSSDGGSPAGGTNSGGASSGGSGTGGSVSTPAPTVPLVTDFPTANKASYVSGNLSGAIKRYAQSGVVWAASSEAGMVVARPDDSSNFWMNVKGDFPDVDGWGTDIVIPLRTSGVDISGFTGIRIEAAGFITDDSLLRIAIEDEYSHRPSSGTCPTDGTLPDCDDHAESLDSYQLTDTVDTLEFPLAFFTDSCGGGGTCTRENVVNLKKVYALHFRMDPTVETTMDFGIDNITFY